VAVEQDRLLPSRQSCVIVEQQEISWYEMRLKVRFCIAFALFVAFVCTDRVCAELMHKIDFEKGSPEIYSINGAQITNAPGSVLSGNRSLIANFSNASDEWHEFLTTSEQVRFVPGHTYHVSFKYRVIDEGENETRFYSLLRSRSGGDKYGEFWLWKRETGAEGIIHRLFRIDEKDDWMLIIGVRHKGAILIDDVEIRRCEGKVPGLEKPIKPCKTDLIERKSQLDRLRDSEGLGQLLGDMLIVWCNEGAGEKIVNAREQYALELKPDFVDWNPCGPLAKDFGVRTSVGGPEYQEFYKMEGPDVWQSRMRMFGDNGFAESLDGTLIQDETWGEGGYFTCHNGDGWHEWFISKLLKRNQEYLGMCQDNIACAPWYKGHGCFCKPCLTKFRTWLKSRYSSDELNEFGITDVDKFDYRERVVTFGLIGNQALEDPVTREYIKFQFASQLAAWADVVERVKADGKQRGFSVPCYGNQIGAFGMWPFAVAIGEFCDVIEIEEVIGVGDKIPNQSWVYKMGRASGHNEKPVWVRGPVYDDKKEHTPQLSPMFWRVHFAEALANGGVRDISFGMNAPWTGDPTTLDFIDSPELRKVWKEYADLCDANRAVFIHRESLAKVALVYSLPTMMFRRFYPLDIDDNSYFSRFDKTAKLLDSEHVPYDCIVFGHSELFPTAVAQLKKYSVLVLPSADALSDVQIGLLKDFAARGGTVVKIGEIGRRDENLNKRESTVLSDVAMLDLEKDRDKALSALRAASVVTADVPKDVIVNVWSSAGGASVDLHLVNYGADIGKGMWNPVKPFKVSVKLPNEFKPDTVRMLRFGKQPEKLRFTIEKGVASVMVPTFEDYVVVSFAQKSKLEAANAAAQKRREEDKAFVKRLAQEKGLY
jgi:hypothetical protein